jgi:hypothetical protein
VLPSVGAEYVLVVAICTHAEPDQTYMFPSVEFQ